MEMMLQTQNLCKYFRKQKAVNNVSGSSDGWGFGACPV